MNDEYSPAISFLDVLVFIAALLLIMFLFHVVIRKGLGLRKRPLFKQEFVNETHKKWDKISRGIGIALTIILYFYFIATWSPIEWFYLMLILLFFLPAVTQAYMEWKYGDGWKEALYTVAEMVVLFAVAFLLLNVLF